MTTVAYKGQDWPVSDAWAQRRLAGAFVEFPTWRTDALWDRLWAILRKSDETLADRTTGMSHAEVAELMGDPERARALLDTLSSEELDELRALEAHIIVRNRVDHLLGRELAEFDIRYIDHAHGQGAGYACGCELLAVLDDAKLARAQAGEGVKVLHAHYPRRLCDRHAHLQSVVVGAGRWHNMALADRLEQVHETVMVDNRADNRPDNRQEAQPDAAAA